MYKIKCFECGKGTNDYEYLMRGFRFGHCDGCGTIIGCYYTLPGLPKDANKNIDIEEVFTWTENAIRQLDDFIISISASYSDVEGNFTLRDMYFREMKRRDEGDTPEKVYDSDPHNSDKLIPYEQSVKQLEEQFHSSKHNDEDTDTVPQIVVPKAGN